MSATAGTTRVAAPQVDRPHRGCDRSTLCRVRGRHRAIVVTCPAAETDRYECLVGMDGSRGGRDRRRWDDRRVDRPRCVTYNMISVDGRVTLAPGVNLMAGDARWEAATAGMGDPV